MNILICPTCHKEIEGRFWGDNDWRFACNYCGYSKLVNVKNIIEKGKDEA